MTSAASHCPQETELNAFIARTLGAGAAARLEAHLADCDDCRNLVFALASSSIAPAEAEPTVERVGKFEVQGVIGRGAMGIVYKARDPELDRVVAVKVRQGGGKLDVDGEDRVRREAQALARLTHANVVAIFEAGRHEQSTFLAMEYVEGAALDEWLATRRLREDIIGRLVEAGRGLAAAHAAGLVHRDFKPRNVLVSKGGVAKVGDFGLVRVEGDAASDGAAASREHVSSMTLTLSGAMLGTPAYMSPEQLRGDVATEASDQFSFCVTLYEALYGQRPFDGATIEKLLGSMTRPFALPATPRVPAHVGRVLTRGLSLDPAKRFASMTELLDVLDPRAGRRKRGVLIGAVAAGALAVGGVTFAAMRPNQRAELCTGAENNLSGIWDPARKEQIRLAFVASGVPYASDAFKGVEKLVDQFSGEWVAMHRGTCAATRVTGGQSEQVMNLRMWCLDARLREAKAFTDALATGSKRVVSRAVDAAARLPDVAACADARALKDEVPPRDAAARDRIDTLRDGLAKAKTEAEFGKLADGVAQLEQLAERVKGEDYAPLEAQVLVELARKKFTLSGDPKVGEELMKQAVLAAERGHADVVRARAYIVLVFLVGNMQGRFDEAHELAKHASAIIKRLANNEGLEGQLLGNTGQLYMLEGKMKEAEETLTRAAALLEKAVGRDHVETARTLVPLADIMRRRGDHQQSLELSRRAFEIHAKGYGAGHPEAAKSRFGVGVALEDMGKLDEAVVEIQGVIATLETALGRDHVDLAPASDELGLIYRKQGKLKEAEALHRKTLAMREKSYGPEHPDTTLSLDNLALALAKQGKFEEALPLQKRSLAALEASFGPDNPETIAARGTLANVYLDAKKYKEALAEFTRAATDAERVLGPDHHDLTFHLSGIGQVLLAMHKPREAVPVIERALKLRGDQANPNDTAGVRFDLARALWDSKGDRKRALELAESARAAYKSLGMTDVEDWLKTHAL